MAMIRQPKVLFVASVSWWCWYFLYVLFPSSMSVILVVECHAINNKNVGKKTIIRTTTTKNDLRLPLSHDDDTLTRRGLFDRACSKASSFLLGGQMLLLSAPLSGNAEEAVDDEATATTTGGGNGKPYAPIEALLPATRCKIWVDRAYSLTSTLSLPSTANKNNDQTFQILEELNDVLSNRPKLFVNNEKPLSRLNSPAAAQITASVSNANKDQYQQNRASLSIPNQLAAMLNQADVERQWGMLQYAESRQEKENSIRAAFNYYTQQLVFGDSYLLTASKEDKKRMIRNDQLPSLTAVITSDLDLRDLYRNQLLTAIDDVQAEVAYQVKQPKSEIDISDVVTLMNQAHSACDSWFALIAQEDIQKAIDVITNEANK